MLTMTKGRLPQSLFIHRTQHWALITCCVLYIATLHSQALSCVSNIEPGVENCTTSEHRESRCFRSVRRVLENDKYAFVESYGCLSAADDSLYAFQCYTDTRKHKELVSMKCCSTDFCNQDLPDPDPSEDPRWGEPQLEGKPGTDSNMKASADLILWLLVTAVVILSVLCTLICCLSYKITKQKFQNYLAKVKENHKNCNDKSSSTGSVYSIKMQLDQPYKDHYADLQHNPASSSASTRTYTESDNLSQKSIEHTSTLPDLTSGRGSRWLRERTMARVIDSGVTIPVGSGRFGRVFKGIFKGEDIAVKAFRAIDLESFEREEKILLKLRHPNIVRYIGSEQYSGDDNRSESWLFLEYCPDGSLCDFLDRSEIWSLKQAIQIIYSIIKGLSFLHGDYSNGFKPPIAHRDIKSRNILMRTPETCCLADFGHAAEQKDENTIDFGSYDRWQVGTVRYMAPEILSPSGSINESKFFTFAQADLYQFSLVLWEVCNRTELDVSQPGGAHKLPYDGVVPHDPKLEDMIKIVCEDNYRPPSTPWWEQHDVMKKLSSLMIECWRPNPKARMETLGVKMKIQELHDQVMWKPPTSYHDII